MKVLVIASVVTAMVVGCAGDTEREEATTSQPSRPPPAAAPTTTAAEPTPAPIAAAELPADNPRCASGLSIEEHKAVLVAIAEGQFTGANRTRQ